jgi:predicted nucleic acid-binding protein
LTLVDTNVLVDLVSDNAEWADWSQAGLEAASLRGPLFINEVIYAELSVRYDHMDTLDRYLDEAGIEFTQSPKAALFLAGKAFARYRKAGGSKAGVLPDFFIGAHASITGMPILTRDISRYRTYFPDVTLIAPRE